MSSRESSQINGTARLQRTPENSLQAICQKWSRSESRSKPKLSLIARLNHLHSDLQSLYTTSAQRDALRRSLLVFLTNKDNTYEIDEYVRWFLLCQACDKAIASQDDDDNDNDDNDNDDNDNDDLQNVDPSNAYLCDILFEINPILVFQTLKDGFENPHGGLDKFGTRQTTSDVHDAHLKNCVTRFGRTASPILIAIRTGAVSIVDNAITSAKAFIERQNNEEKDLIRDIFMKKFEDGDGLVASIVKYYLTDTSQDFIKVIESLIKLDHRIAGDCKFFRTAMTVSAWDLVKSVLALHLQSTFLDDGSVCHILKLPSGTIPEDQLELLGATLTRSTASRIIEENLEAAWSISSVQQRFAKLIREDVELGHPSDECSRKLMDVAVTSETSGFVDKILNLIPEALDAHVAYRLVEMGCWDIWTSSSVQKAWVSLRRQNPELDLLPTAIQNSQIKFVESFVREYPDTVMIQTPVREIIVENGQEECRNKYPLWHNNFRVGSDGNIEKKESCEDIRKVLIAACIRYTDDMQKLSEVFHDSGELVQQFCLDLSLFDSRAFSFDHFCQSLISQHDPLKKIAFESTIRFVEFPELDPTEEDSHGKVNREHREVFAVLDWLHDKKGVEEIVSLSVPDRIHSPHCEVEIAKYLDKFKVSYVNWKCLDMSLSDFTVGTRSRLKALHLYSSGKRAPVNHWLSRGTIGSLVALETLEIHIVEDYLNGNRLKAHEQFINAALHQLQQSEQSVEFKATSERWAPFKIPVVNSLAHIATKALPKLWPFISLYQVHIANQKQFQQPWQPTRIAILDNGIMPVVPLMTTQGDAGIGGESNQDWELWPRIEQGRSFVDENYNVSSWSFASDPHGTQMANLICSVDPHCKVFVGKVTEGKYDVAAARVVKAIDWAIKEKVDIISMSFAIFEPDNSLKQAVVRADAAGILMLCSSHDEGLDHVQAFPASYIETIAIAAAEEFGAPTARVPNRGYQYRLHASKIQAGLVPFIQSDDKVSGSSVATAIAAGLSSLIISCHRLANNNPASEPDRKWRRALVENKFGLMAKEDYVQLDKFCDLQARLQRKEKLNATEMIEKWFCIH